jgi:sulfur-carrier protein
MPSVKLYAGLRKVASSGEALQEGDSVRMVLIGLVQQYPALQPLLMDGNELRQYVTIVVNGHNIDLAAGLDTPVEPDDQIAIFPPLAGG